MTYLKSITDKRIQLVKGLLGYHSLREIERKTGLSYYSVWCIKEGKYDHKNPLQEKKKVSVRMFNEGEYYDWITGEKITKRA